MQLKHYSATIDFDVHSPETPWSIIFSNYLSCRFALLRDAEQYIVARHRFIKMTDKAKRASEGYPSDFKAKYIELEE